MTKLKKNLLYQKIIYTYLLLEITFRMYTSDVSELLPKHAIQMEISLNTKNSIIKLNSVKKIVYLQVVC